MEDEGTASGGIAADDVVAQPKLSAEAKGMRLPGEQRIRTLLEEEAIN
jgi:hypothetical protein